MTPRQRQRGGLFGRVLAALFVVVTLFSLYLLRAPILRSAANMLVAEDELQPADAIVILGDDNFAADRASRAAELFQARWAPVVVASGRYIRAYASIADLMARDLTERGVATEHILPLRHTAASTREEARAVGRLAQERRWRRLIVVTSSYHTRRARYIFRDVLGTDLDVRVAAAADGGFDPRAWWQVREGRKLFLRESLAWLAAWWEAWTNEGDEAPAETSAARRVGNGCWMLT